LSKFEEKINSYQTYLQDAFSEGDFKSARERAKQFDINELDLSEEVASQPAMFSYIATLYAKAKGNRNKAKLDVKVCEAVVKRRLKDENPKLTVDATAAMAISDPEVLQQHGNFIAAEELVDHLDADVEASRQKSDMLKLLSAMIKREQNLKSYT
jgi:hypothetical protein